MPQGSSPVRPTNGLYLFYLLQCYLINYIKISCRCEYTSLHLAAGVPDGGCLKSAAVIQCSVTVVNLGVQYFDLP